MRLGTVIGRITLTQKEPAYTGGHLLIVQPWTHTEFHNAAAPSSVAHSLVAARLSARIPLPPTNSLIVYDTLGARDGSTIGFTEGAEASQPFSTDAPVDAYCACLVDHLTYSPPT